MPQKSRKHKAETSDEKKENDTAEVPQKRPTRATRSKVTANDDDDNNKSNINKGDGEPAPKRARKNPKADKKNKDQDQDDEISRQESTAKEDNSHPAEPTQDQDEQKYANEEDNNIGVSSTLSKDGKRDDLNNHKNGDQRNEEDQVQNNKSDDEEEEEYYDNSVQQNTAPVASDLYLDTVCFIFFASIIL